MAVTVLSDGVPVTLDTRLWSLNPDTVMPFSSSAYVGSSTVDALDVWRTQPSIRTVVGFLARNIAQVPLHGFVRDGEDRGRLDRADPLSQLLARPERMVDPMTGRTVTVATAYESTHSMVIDLCLFDRYAARIDIDADTNPFLTRLPPSRWWFDRDTLGRPVAIRMLSDNGRDLVEIPLSDCVWVDGYPVKDRSGVQEATPLQALAELLYEDAESTRYRSQLWRRSGRFGGWVERPANTPWSSKDRTTFRDSLKKYAAEGDTPGAAPIFEDGMKYHETMGLTPESAQQLESRKFTMAVAAATFHLPPVFAGLLDNANYSNVVAYREILYSDTLGTWFQQLQQAFNTRLLPHPAIGVTDGSSFVEFNVAEKLRMSFEEQARIFQTTTGAPIMTRNEARRRLNLPALDGADELIVPLNVIEGGQASPTDTAPDGG